MENYESCIRIKGLHFLPPVITDKRRMELQRFKQQAVKLEKRLRNCRKLKRNLEELMQAKILSQQEKTMSDTMKASNLSVDIVSVTEFSSNGIKVWSRDECQCENENMTTIELNNDDIQLEDIECNKESIEDKANSSTETYSLSHTFSFDKSSQVSNNVFRKTDIDELDQEAEKHSISTDTFSNISDLTSPCRPRLIRSNSYTLDTPSPILLAHLEKTNKHVQIGLSEHNLAKNCSLEDNYLPFERSEFSSMDTVLNTDDISCSDSKSKDCHSPQVAVVQTDISVQHISVRGEEGDDKKLMEVLEKIPETYSKQILELIEKHFGTLNMTNDTQEMKENVTVQNNQDTQQMKENVTVQNDKNTQQMKKNINDQKDENFSASNEDNHVQQLHKNITIQNNSSPTKIEYYPGGQKMTSTYVEQRSCNKNRAVIPAVDSCILRQRRLSFSNDAPYFTRAMNSIRREWAARVICAYAKGYLTRRLLKTERVQSLIMTIKDALICALQLHSADNINEADVELHRRLINQVSSACYAFHDVFFAFSIPEQMAMITADRQRKQEKSKRPSSAPTSRSRLSSRSSRQFTSQSRSLTNI